MTTSAASVTPWNTLVLKFAGASPGEALQFRTSIDGIPLGGVQAPARTRTGGFLPLTFIGKFGSGSSHSLMLAAAAASGTSGAAASLSLQSVQLGWTTYQTPISLDAGQQVGLTMSGPKASIGKVAPVASVTANPASANSSSSLDVLVLSLSEDAYAGDARFSVSVDGVTVGGSYFVTANHAAGESQSYILVGSFGSGPHTVTVNYLNDAAGATGDRNLYLDSIWFDGQNQAASASFLKGGARNFTVNAASSTSGTGGTTTSSGSTGSDSGSGSTSTSGSTSGSSGSSGSTTTGTATGTTTGSATGTTTVTTSSPALPAGVVGAPALPQAQNPGDVVCFGLRNDQGVSLGARAITFDQVFLAGQVTVGRSLVATINGQTFAVQMDVKSTYADGSVRMALLTLQAPALAAGATVTGMLSVATASAAPAVDISQLTRNGFSLTVDLALHQGSTTTSTHLDAASLLKAALAAGSVSYWMSGPQATEVRVDAPVAGSLHVVFDIRLYAGGAVSTDVQFNNDLAMTASGGEAKYDVTIRQAGAVAFQQANIDQFQYQDWHRTFATNGSAEATVIHDVSYLERAGAIQNYDTSVGVAASFINGQTSSIQSNAGVLGAAGITQGMPTTGGRNDIGPTTGTNAAWLISQNGAAAANALAQADAAGSIPWHFFDPVHGTYLSQFDYPNIWIDGRGGPSSNTTGLTQQVSTSTGWTTDTSHQPDLSYTAYLLTGDRVYLDELNAQASFAIAYTWPGYRTNDDVIGKGLQPREQAWDLREIDEAAYANPDGSAEKAYFTKVENDNWKYLLSQIPSLTQQEGQAYGYLIYDPGDALQNVQPWQNDYFASTVIAAAEQGNTDAVQVLKWMQNFLVGRFLNGENGFNPRDGAAYRLTVAAAGTNTPLKTWAEIGQATVAAGYSNGASWDQSQGDYAPLALQSLAGIITVLGSPSAIKAYGWLVGNGPQQYLGGASNTTDPQFNIVPRLSDGTLLSGNRIFRLSDNTATIVQGGNTDQMIVETGAGVVTLNGGSGIDMLFAGTGAVTLNGNGGDDFLFGGSGANVLSGGAGTNYLDGGSGADVFVFSTLDVARDTVADFKTGVDQLLVVDGSGKPVSNAQIAAILASATTDASGNLVLKLASAHTVTLLGVGSGQLGTSNFASKAPASASATTPITYTDNLAGWGALAASTSSSAGASAGGSATSGSAGSSDGTPSGGGTSSPPAKTVVNASGNLSLSDNGYTITGGASPLTVSDTAGRNVITGGSGGLTFTTTGGAEVITTAANVANTITLYGQATVYSNGRDLINAGFANQTLIVTGNSVVNGSTGNSQITFAGTDVLNGVGQDWVTVSKGASVTINAGIGTYVTENAGSVTLSVSQGANRGSATVSGGAASLQGGTAVPVQVTTIAGVKTSVTLGTGTTSVLSQGPDAITAGAGTATVTTGAAGVEIWGGSGNLKVHDYDWTAGDTITVHGGSGSLTYDQGPGALTFIGGSGSAAIDGQYGSLKIQGGSGTLAVTGGSAGFDFTAGSGTATVSLTAGGGHLVFGAGKTTVSEASYGTAVAYDFLAGHGGGLDIINGFRPGVDKLNLVGVTVSSQSIGSGAANLALSDGSRLQLTGVTSLQKLFA